MRKWSFEPFQRGNDYTSAFTWHDDYRWLQRVMQCCFFLRDSSVFHITPSNEQKAGISKFKTTTYLQGNDLFGLLIDIKSLRPSKLLCRCVSVCIVKVTWTVEEAGWNIFLWLSQRARYDKVPFCQHWNAINPAELRLQLVVINNFLGPIIILKYALKKGVFFDQIPLTYFESDLSVHEHCTNSCEVLPLFNSPFKKSFTGCLLLRSIQPCLIYMSHLVLILNQTSLC